MDLVAALLALAAMIVAFVPRVPPSWPATAAGAVSIAITVAHPLGGWHDDTAPWMLVEVPPLLVLTFVAVRRAPAPRAVVSAGLAGGAVALMLVRALWPGDLDDRRRSLRGLVPPRDRGDGDRPLRPRPGQRSPPRGGRCQADAAARARPRPARLRRPRRERNPRAGAGRPACAGAAPAAGGRRAAAHRGGRAARSGRHGPDRPDAPRSRQPDRASAEPLPGVDGLARLVGGYSPSVRVDLSVEPGLERHLSQETSATVYRVVTEALTNVRRHACEATSVGVTVARVEESVRVRVTDDGGGYSEAAGRGGFGLAGLTSGRQYSAARCRPGPGRAAGGSRRFCPSIRCPPTRAGTRRAGALREPSGRRPWGARHDHPDPDRRRPGGRADRVPAHPRTPSPT